MNGIKDATSLVLGYFEPLTKLIYGIAAITGDYVQDTIVLLCSGDPDTSKTAASWFGACIFMIVAGTILKSFFIQT